MVEPMELDIMDYKNRFAHLSVSLLIIMAMFNTCTTLPFVDYEPLDTNGKRLATVERNTYSYNQLIDKGFVSYIEFSRLGNTKYSQISISLYTLKKYNALKIHSLEFEFENKKKIVSINKTIKLNHEDDLFFVNDNNELNVMAYFDYIYRDHNKIKLYMQNIFNKNIDDIGKIIDLTLKANYSFDNGDIVTQENKYSVYILEFIHEPSNWMGNAKVTDTTLDKTRQAQ
jgi:hypothetical protein